MPASPQRALGWTACAALLGFCCLAAPGCTIHAGRGPVADFFAKDYDLPPYRADVAAFQRERQSARPEATTGALGSLAGAVAGGRRRAWRAAVSGGLGGLAGATVGGAFAEAQAEAPLPPDYEVFNLALPIVATDPNKGPTVGLLPVAVLEESTRITNIFAPDVTYNQIEGLGGKFRMRRYFRRDSLLYLDAGTSSEGADDYEVRYSQRRLGPNEFLYYRARLAYRADLSSRFYGIGNDTDEDDETSYVFRRTLAEAELGLELPLDLRVDFQERIVSYKVGPGRIEDIPSTRAVFGNIDGISQGRITILAHQIRLTYDSRDSRSVPSEGIFGQFTYEIADEALGSDLGFQRFGLACTVLFPKFQRRFVTVVRFAGWIMTGERIPFYELTVVGGKATHRGYGFGRFVDRNGYVANVEERMNLADFVAYGKRLIFQLAGFVDVGRVFAEGESFSFDDTKIAAGGAVRLIVPDSELVTSIDLGISDEGTAAFVGLDYPF